MKPNAFHFIKVDSLADLLGVLKARDDVKIIAGGQSLVPMMNFRLAQPETLVDINGVIELRHITKEHDRIRIGAMTRYREILQSPIVQQDLPLLAAAAKHIGYPAIRNRGTVGGSLVHNDPSAEMGVALSCLGAEVMIVNGDGDARSVPLDQFFVTTYLTDIGPSEVLTEIRVPVPAPGSGYAFEEVSKRVGDFGIVNAAALIRRDPAGRVLGAAFAFGGIGECPLRLDIEPLIRGKCLDATLVDQIVAWMQGQIDPQNDNVASGGYKRHLGGVLMKRCLLEACAKARAV